VRAPAAARAGARTHAKRNVERRPPLLVGAIQLRALLRQEFHHLVEAASRGDVQRRRIEGLLDLGGLSPVAVSGGVNTKKGGAYRRGIPRMWNLRGQRTARRVSAPFRTLNFVQWR